MGKGALISRQPCPRGRPSRCEQDRRCAAWSRERPFGPVPRNGGPRGHGCREIEALPHIPRLTFLEPRAPLDKSSLREQQGYGYEHKRMHTVFFPPAVSKCADLTCAGESRSWDSIWHNPMCPSRSDGARPRELVHLCPVHGAHIPYTVTRRQL